MSDDSSLNDKEKTSDQLDDEAMSDAKTESTADDESELDSDADETETDSDADETETDSDTDKTETDSDTDESETDSDTEHENESGADSDEIPDTESDESEETDSDEKAQTEETSTSGGREKEPVDSKPFRGDSSPLMLVSPPKGEEEENDKEIFATDDAPWVGAEKEWRVQSGIPKPPEQMNQPEMAYDSRDSSPSNPDLYHSDSYIPGNIGPDSLPALAANRTNDSGKMSTEAKLGATAASLAIVVLIAISAWWMLDEESSKSSALLAAQQRQIDMLKKQIAERSSTNNPEDRKLVAQLQAELGEAEAKATETVNQLEIEPSEEKLDEDTDENQKQGSESSEKEKEKEKEKEEESAEEVSTDTGEALTITEEPAEKEGEIPDDPYGAADPSSSDKVMESSPRGSSPVVSNEKDEMEDLINQAVNVPSRTKDPSSETENQPPAGANQPSTNPAPSSSVVKPNSTPSRSQVKAAMGAVAPGVKRCGGSGRIVLKIAVAGATGRVLSAQPVSPGHSGTPIGICAARAVRLAKFPKFTQQRLVIKYPFDF